jgi:hypothetical protein
MLLLATVAAASPWLGNLEAYTSFPTDVGLRGTLEGPGRVRVTGSVGLLPRPYLGVINDTATAQGWYDDDTADLVDAALQDALVLRAHVGWRPFPKLGFQFELGYGWIGLGGGLTSAQILEAEYGYDFGWLLGDDYDFAAAATLHRVEASVGWEHVIGTHLLVRWDLGASYTLDATARVEREFDGWPFDAALDDLQDDAEDDLERVLERHVHTPIVALGVGWRFQ